MKLARVFANQPETLLVLGPTGAGKTRLARWCRGQSQRASGPFEAIDLTTIPDDMQMAKLFGWKRGAFTGAVEDYAGVVERAQQGTLFIDEIDKLSMKAQAGLLSFLESRNYRRLGNHKGDKQADVRLVIGTNADLKRAVATGDFR